MDKQTNPLNLEEIKGLMAAATKGTWVAFDQGGTLAIMKGKRPPSKANGYPVRRWPAIVNWPGFDSADTSKQKRRADLHLIVAAVNALPTLIEQYERMADDVRIWKREAEERSQRMVELNLDRAAQGVTIMQLREALENAALGFDVANDLLDTIGAGRSIMVETFAERARSALTQQEETNVQ
jgi:hypothetical protein